MILLNILMLFYKHSTETHNLANTVTRQDGTSLPSHTHTITTSLASNDAKHEPMVS